MNISTLLKSVLSASVVVAGIGSVSAQFLPFNRPVLPEIGKLAPGGAPFSRTPKADARGPIYYIGENNPLRPPFTETFDNLRAGLEYDDFARYFQVLDANNDERKWGLYNYPQAEPYGRCAYLLFPLTTSADDWLITRAIRLEKGKYYCISMDAALYLEDTGDRPQIFEVKVGTYNDADGLNSTVIEPTKISSKSFTHVQGWFKPDFTATYYVGVHGISPYYEDYYNYLFVDNISVDAPREGGVPAEVANVSMTNDRNGSLAVEIEFDAPKVSLDGNALTEITSLSLLRDNEVIKEYTSVTPGQKLFYTDVPEEEKAYTYSFVAYNSLGIGAVYYKSHTNGVAAPVPPVITSFRETDPGVVNIKWEAPTVDVNGNELNPDLMTYNLYDAVETNSFLIDAGIQDTEYTYTLQLEEGEQKATLGLLTAVFNDKESEQVGCEFIAVGKPYDLPYHNSFTLDDYYKYVMITDVMDDVTWRMLDDFSDPDSQDGDNGFVCMIGSQPGHACELQSGKIDLAGAKAPVLSFFTYVYSEDENQIEVSVLDAATGERSLLSTVKLSNYTRVGWNRVVLPLTQFTGKVVRIGLKGIILTHGYIPVDNMLVRDTPKVDMAVDEVSHQQQAYIDEEFWVKATIFNGGSEEAVDYSVLLMTEDGKEVCRVSGPAIPHLGSTQVTLHDSFNISSPASTRYYVKVEIEGDNNAENDNSLPFDVTFITPNYPVVNDLKADKVADVDVQLTWSPIDLASAAPEEVTEDFESYAPFADTFNGWSTETLDEGYVAGFSGVSMPVDGSLRGFWVMGNEDDFNFLNIHGGNRMAVAMYGMNASHTMSVASDDWLISPELYGGAQTVNFWASSYTEDYGLEQFEVLYSTTTSNPEAFNIVRYMTEAPVDWTNYFVALPEGSKYFAIRYVSDNRFMFQVDDITYIPVGEPRKLTLMGYNVYRNNELITPKPISATTYSEPVQSENDIYFVTAVYAEGESVASNHVSIGLGSIDGVSNDMIDGNCETEMFDIRGIKVSPSNAVPGVYILRQGSKVSKVVVR